ncbi:MAG: glycine cleavage system aminomethyltransferase GcvT [Elusimicrobia bacterium]|nr:glycine cleavage system aminomethyltransferase GcvT [Elusimicrobiota bacterium]
MSTVAALRRTALYYTHKDMGAKLVDFHGWELPIQFTSILKEHQAVRAHCGLFDVSHMGQIFAQGRGALEFLQRVASNDVRRAPPGKAVYSHILNESGGVVDDVIISCLSPNRYLVVVNAATTEKDFEWFRKQARDADVELRDQSAGYGMLAIQGPRAAQLLAELVPGCAALPRFGVLEVPLFGQPSIVQRTGYTGEDGFEAVVPNEIVTRLWEELMTRGRSFGLAACGLGARDTLRLEAGFLLYGQDIDDDRTPLEAGYDWVVRWDKGDFIGRDALMRQKERGLGQKWTGLKLRGGGVPRAGTEVFAEGGRCGVLTSATFSPSLQIGVGIGYLTPPNFSEGMRVEVELHGRKVAAEVTALPFYSRPMPKNGS